MVSKVLAVLFAILMIPSVVAWWFETDFIDDKNYLEIVTPLAADPEMEALLGSAISAEVRADVDVDAMMNAAAIDLPPRSAATMRLLADPMEMAVDNYIRRAAESVLGSEDFATTWTMLNRVAHHNNLVTEGDTVYLELGPMVEAIKADLLGDAPALATRLPRVNERYALLTSSLLAKALRHEQVIRVLMYVLPILAIILLAVAICLSRLRCQTVLIASMSTAAAMLTLLAATYVAHHVVAPETPKVVYEAFAASLRSDISWVLATSAIVALITWVLKRRITNT